jgi:hypothetical protein
MEQRSSWEANSFSASQENSPHFMDSEGSLPHLQEPATCPHPEPAQYSPCPRLTSWSSSLCSLLHSPVASSLLGPNILLSTLLSHTLSLCSSLSVRDQVSHPYKTTRKTTVLYTLIFMFLDSNLEDKRFCTAYQIIISLKIIYFIGYQMKPVALL